MARDDEIVPAVVANGGEGSNLDTDKLDGKDSTEFLGKTEKAADAIHADQADTANTANTANTATNARNAETLEGKAPSEFAAAVHNHDSSYIQQSPASAENASIHITGTMRTGGTLRTGSGTGTSQPPDFDGLVVRRINSTNHSAGQVLARTDQVRLERDGTIGGLRLAWNAFSGGDNTTVNCMGIDSSGAAVNHYSRPVPISGSAGTAHIFTDAQGVVYATCSYGDSVFSRHLTQVTMQRAAGDNFWVGTVLSSFNQ